MRTTLFIIAGILCAGMGIHGFLLSSNFIDGGVTGFSMLLEKITKIPIAYLLPAVNAPFIFVAYHYLGKRFALKSCFTIGGLALVLAYISFPDVTSDKVLTAVFGGFFIGAGIGLTIRGGAVLDGTEILALLVSKRFSFLKVGDVIMLLNVVLFLGAMAALGVEPALYSILTYYTAAKTLDFVLHGIDEFTAMTIVSTKSESIKDRITNELGRGVTVYLAKGGASDEAKEVLYSVVTRLEIGKVEGIIKEIDPLAFFTAHPLVTVYGGVVPHRSVH